MKFPEKIDNLLTENGIKNLRKLAEEINIPYTTLWDYYSNQIRLDKANLTYIKKIADRLGCTIDYLAYDEIDEKNGFSNNTENKLSSNNIDDIQVLLDAYKGLTENDKEFMKKMIIERRKQIDKQLGENNQD